MNVGNLISAKREINLPFNAFKRSKGDFSRELFISTELFDKVGAKEFFGTCNVLLFSCTHLDFSLGNHIAK